MGNWPPGSTLSWPTAEQVQVGDEALPRYLGVANTLAAVSQQVRLTFFTALKTETVAQVRFASGNTAAGPTPSLIRAAVYQVADLSTPGDGMGDLTLLGASASDTSLLAAANTVYTTPLTAPFVKTAGTRYAVGLLLVTAAAAPTYVTAQIQSQLLLSIAPRLGAVLNGQADIPASIPNGSLTAASGMVWFTLLPS